MKVRENELHEPRLETKGYLAIAYCAVCGNKFGFRHGYTEEGAIAKVKRCYKNYCPNCGARLKEI